MHDNGYHVSLRCKILLMPTCFFTLTTFLFVQFHHVLIRSKEEVRIFCKFPTQSLSSETEIGWLPNFVITKNNAKYKTKNNVFWFTRADFCFVTDLLR